MASKSTKPKAPAKKSTTAKKSEPAVKAEPSAALEPATATEPSADAELVPTTSDVPEPVAETEDAPEPAVKAEPEPEVDGEAAVVEQLANDEMVRFYVPRDPTSGDEQFFERSINGHIIRLRAGEIRTLPLSLVEFIEDHIAIQRMAERSYDAYKTKNGKLLQ